MTITEPTIKIRIARPTQDLAAAERFWTAGAGFEVLWKSTDPSEPHPMTALGWPAAPWHLELVEDVALAQSHPSSEEDLLVLYLDADVDAGLLNRLLNAGGRRVAARNPYWDKYGVTIVDPDGHRLVLCRRGWSR